MNRELILADLFNTVGATSNFTTRLRKWVQIQQTTEAERPMLLMLEDDEDWVRPRAGMPPTRIFLQVTFLIYAWTMGLDNPAKVLNDLLDPITDVLKPDPGEQLGIYSQTLNGKVYDAWVVGKVIKVPGYRDGNGLAVLPVKVLVPGP